MPASHSGFAGFLDRSISMAAGYQIPLLGCPTGIQAQQPPHHLGSMAAGVPVAFPGLPGYNFIPYPHHRHMAHMNTAFELKVASPYHHHHHHHALLARGGPPFYPAYRPGSAEDPGRVAKVATRESTGALKAWLNEHLKNPYPTKGEKIMLAIITKMSLTQVSTWFANARRRLKKENRVSWASKGKSEDEEEEEDGDEGDEGEGESEEDERSRLEDRVERPAGGDMDEDPETQGSDHPQKLDMTHGDGGGKAEEDRDPEKTPSPLGGGKDSAAACQKPKIWSLAETATSEPARKHTSPDRGFRGPQQGSAVGRLWVDWAARNGLYLPPPYNPTMDTL